MSHAEPARAGLWTDPIFAAIRLPPFAVGALLAGLLLAALIALAAATGGLAELEARGLGWWEHRDGRLGVLLALLGATLPTALRYHELGTRRNLEALARSDLWGASPPVDLRAAPVGLSRGIRVGLMSLLIVPVISFSIDRQPGLYFTRDYWGMAQIWHWLLGSAICFCGGLLTYRVLVDARRFAALARALPRVDLLEREGLLPFAHQGLRAVIPGLIILTFLALNLGDRDFWMAILALGGLTAAQLVGFLVLPLAGLRERVRAAKREEIARVHAAIRGDPGALRESPLARNPDPNLADLLAWRRFVESVPEWPIDASTLGHTALYLGIPLLSWVGAALVERVVDALIR